MPRYLVERSFRHGFDIPPGEAGVDRCRGLVEINDAVGVTWVHSYVRDDRAAMFCVYDAPNPESIRRAAERNGLPVDRITRVTVLDPYFYAPRADTAGVSAVRRRDRELGRRASTA
jgi:hypothetical protein